MRRWRQPWILLEEEGPKQKEHECKGLAVMSVLLCSRNRKYKALQVKHKEKNGEGKVHL